jgi:hypothetical protein
MRLLHVSDLLLGNLNYRRDVREANGGHDLMDLDRQAAFDRAVGCAIEHDVDVLLVSGGLLDGRGGHLDEYRPWLDQRLQQLHAADVTPVIYDPQRQLDGLDATLLGDDHVVEAAGITFAPLALARARALEHDELVVAVGHGCMPGIGGSATFDRELDDRLVGSLEGAVAYTALGGMLECQPLTPSAWYCGAACGLFAYHPGSQGGVIVQLGRATRRVLDLIHVAWSCRQRVSVTLDVGSMDADQIAGALHQRLDAVCFAVDDHDPLDEGHPLAELYGAQSDRNGVGWWSRPVIDLKVNHAACSLSEVLDSHPLLRQMLTGGEHLLAHVAWRAEGEPKPTKHKFVPARS